MSTRTKGLLVAGGLLCLFAAVIAAVSLTSRRPAPPEAPGGPAEPPPDISNINPSGHGPGTLAGTSRLFLQVADPQNPTRVQAEITADRSDPLPEQRIRMDEPRATVYLEDGRRIFISARSGRATIPKSAGNRPTDALLEGGVVVRLLSREATDDDASLGSIVARSLRLDVQRGELEITDSFSFTSPTLDLDGRGLLVLFDERTRRVESLHIEEATRCVARPGDASRTPGQSDGVTPASGTPRQAPPARTLADATPARAGPAPAETLYKLVLPAAVVVRQGERSLSADRADVFVRLIDNSLPSGAIAPVSLAAAAPAPSAHSKPVDTATAAPPLRREETPPPTQQPQPSLDDDEPITFAWSGPLQAVPVISAPELARDHVFVRFTSPGGVVAMDPASGSTGVAERLEYCATRREASLVGSPDKPIRLEQESRGVIQSARLDLSIASGLVRVPGSGSISTPADGDKPPARVSWTGEGEFRLDTQAGRLGGNLKSARVLGEVEASDASGHLRANSVTVEFGASNVPRQLSAIGAVRATDADGAAIEGDALTADFAAGTRRPVLNHLLVQGSAAARHAGESIAAQRIEAWLTPADGAARIDRVEATGNAAFSDAEGRHASASRIVAWPPTRLVHLEGSGASVGQHDSTIRGDRFILNGRDSTLEVPGPGRIDHPIAGNPPARAAVEWTDGLWYDEKAGVARCVGSTRAVLTRGEDAIDTLTGDIILAELVERKEGESPRLSCLDVIGADKNATIEIRRYQPGTPRTLERLLFIEGPRIIADDGAGTLEIPGAGKLLALDRRSAREAARASPTPFPTETAQGTALLSWNKRFHLDTSAGRARVEESARLVHDREDGSARTQVDADLITAMFRPKAPPDGSEPAFDGDLLSAHAVGAVRVRSGTRELTAPTLDYDAHQALVEATGSPDQPVTITDANGASPALADRLRWFLRTDRIEATGLRPITTPR